MNAPRYNPAMIKLSASSKMRHRPARPAHVCEIKQHQNISRAFIQNVHQ